jgi:hypothetical protein
VNGYPDVKSRLDHILQMCRYPTPTKFMEALGRKPQNWANWRDRDTLGRDPVLIAERTGASLEWLMTGRGEPFPNGPIVYVGATDLPADIRRQLDGMELAIADLVLAVGTIMSRAASTTPDAARAVALDLRRELAKPDRPSAVLPTLLRAVEMGIASQAASAAPDTKKRSSK